MKVDSVVKKETVYIATVALVLSALMQSVFLVCRLWTWRVLTGNLFGYVFAVLNFFLMGLTVQKAVGQTEDEAKTTVKSSQLMRNLMLIAVLAVGMIVPVFNRWAVVIPLFFPRIAVALRPLIDRKSKS